MGDRIASSFAGGCHCGALTVSFSTRWTPAELPVRACQCSFCVRHAGRTVSDPEGEARLVARDPAALQRYRFGLGTADFWICNRCGVYLGAVAEVEGRTYAVVNIHALDERAAFTGPVQPMSYDGEDATARGARRAVKWTPAQIQIGAVAPSE
jgi:hypothetical protein